MDIGKKYKDMIKLFNNDKIKQCERCGDLIDKNEKNNNKYCSKCIDERVSIYNSKYYKNITKN